MRTATVIVLIVEDQDMGIMNPASKRISAIS